MKSGMPIFENRRSKAGLATRGFSLIEVVMALSITVFAVLSILGLLGGALQVNRDSEQRIQAANLAATIIEEYREVLNGQASSTPVTWPPNFPISNTTLPATAPSDYPSPVGISARGAKTGGLSDPATAYALSSIVWKNPNPPGVAVSPYEVVNCSLKLEWPPAGKKALAHYEVTTSFLVKK